MQITPEQILIAKYIVAAIVFVVITLAPAYLAAKNGKDKLWLCASVLHRGYLDGPASDGYWHCSGR